MNGGISLGNILVIIALMGSLILSWGIFTEKVSAMETQLEKKANKETVEVQFNHIQQQLQDIKELLE
jgi:hypothetical protein